MATATHKPLREDELRKSTTCCGCKRKVGQLPLALFWVIRLEQHALETHAVSRQAGLTGMLGGSAALARDMGPDEAMTRPGESASVMMCQWCVAERFPEVLSAHGDEPQPTTENETV